MIRTSPDQPARRASCEVDERFTLLLRQLGLPAAEHRVLGVTSAQRREGVSTIAVNMALAAAAGDDRVLLVDGNSSQPSLAGRFHVGASPGLGDVLVGQEPFANCLCRTAVENLYLLPVSPDANLLRRTSLRELGDKVDEMRRAFPLAIVDLPPCDPPGICELMARHLDGIVLVVEAERASAGVVQRAKTQLARSGAKLLGVVLNKLR